MYFFVLLTCASCDTWPIPTNSLHLCLLKRELGVFLLQPRRVRGSQLYYIVCQQLPLGRGVWRLLCRLNLFCLFALCLKHCHIPSLTMLCLWWLQYQHTMDGVLRLLLLIDNICHMFDPFSRSAAWERLHIHKFPDTDPSLYVKKLTCFFIVCFRLQKLNFWYSGWNEHTDCYLWLLLLCNFI